MNRRKFISASGIIALGATADLNLPMWLSSSNHAHFKENQKKVEYRINQNGSFNIYTEEIALTGCYPIIDNKQIMPLKVTISDNGLQGKIKYNLPEGIIIIYINKTENDLQIRSELLGFDYAPKWFMPIGNATIKGGESFFHQGIEPGEKSGIVSLQELNNSFTQTNKGSLDGVNSYLVSALIAPSDKCLAWAVNDNAAFLNRSSIINSAIRSVQPDNFPPVEKLWLNFGYSLENIPLAREIQELPPVNFISGSAPYNTIKELIKKIAAHKKISLKKPPAIFIFGELINENSAYEQLKAMLLDLKASKNKANFDTILIASDHSISGDWLLSDSHWPGGLKEATSMIDRHSYVPGISLSPFLVSEKSKLYNTHKEWLLLDKSGSTLIAKQKKEELFYILDTSNVNAFNYMKNIFRGLREAGFKHFKTEDMGFGYHDSTLVNRNSPGKTSAHYYNEVLMMIREEIGEESYWQVTDAPFQAFPGYANSMGITKNNEGEASSDSKQKKLMHMHFAQIFSNVLWQNDPSQINFDKNNQQLNLSDSCTYFNGITGNLLSTPKSLINNSEALRLWQLIKPAPALPDPIMHNWHKMNGIIEISSVLSDRVFALLLINTTKESQNISIDIHGRFKLNEINVYKWTSEYDFTPFTCGETLNYKLKANESALFYIGAGNLKKPGQYSLSGAIINK